MNKLIITIIGIIFFLPSLVFASTADLSVRAQDIKFSTDTLVAGDQIRVYITVKNSGDVDMSGYVAFYVGSTLLGSSQVVTLVAGGENEEAWTDFIVPSGSFNIRVDLKGTDPQDQNSANDTALSPLYTSIEDRDEDGIEDEDDNCIDIANSDQLDTDGDNKGDACDTDDDNDGLSDDFENDFGTDPKNADTDGDGVNDADDYYPDDSSKSVEDTVSIIEEIAQIFENTEEDLQAATDTGVEEEIKTNTLLERTSGSQLNLSSNASFIYVRNGWKTYEFEALAIDGSYSSLIWDFGDGTSSTQKTISHDFRSDGNYIVRLSVIDNEGNTLSDSQEIEISFFHLKNPLVQLIVGALLILLITSVLLITRNKNGIKEKQFDEIDDFTEVEITKKISPKKKSLKKTVTKK